MGSTVISSAVAALRLHLLNAQATGQHVDPRTISYWVAEIERELAQDQKLPS